jgi:signal peptidase II
VVDFLDFHLGGLHWPAFNVADSAIVIGAGLLLIDGLFLRRTTIDGGRGETDARA